MGNYIIERTQSDLSRILTFLSIIASTHSLVCTSWEVNAAFKASPSGVCGLLVFPTFYFQLTGTLLAYTLVQDHKKAFQSNF